MSDAEIILSQTAARERFNQGQNYRTLLPQLDTLAYSLHQAHDGGANDVLAHAIDAANVSQQQRDVLRAILGLDDQSPEKLDELKKQLSGGFSLYSPAALGIMQPMMEGGDKSTSFLYERLMAFMNSST